MSDKVDTHECLICLSELQEYDIEFPLLCPTKCANVCYNCLSHLKSNRLGGETLSIGGPACPSCRRDVSGTINDTYTMRGVRRLTVCVAEGTPDSELSGAELRLKYSITQLDIENAERRLQNFALNRSISGIDNPTQNDRGEKKNQQSSELAHMIDVPLLDGLESYMSEAEQIYITELFTSGDTNKLAQAAQILSEIRKLNVTEEKENDMSSALSPITLLQQKKNLSEAEERALRMSLPQNKLQQKQLPPMPKHVVLKPDFDVYAAHRKVLKFKDDGWDGTIADGFARAYTMSSFQDDGSEGDEEGEFTNNACDGNRKSNRILVTASRRQARSAGIKEGDCVTHVNMDAFNGTAKNLKDLINTFYLTGDPTMTFTLTLNAEQSTADVLKQRLK